MKSKFSKQDYKKLYPTGSTEGRFYGTAKNHKLKEGDGVDKLPLRPIVSNIGTPSYHLAKYLAKLLSPLSQSEYTISSTKDFIQQIRDVKVPEGHKLISFDVTSLFTNVPLDETINIILNRIYVDKEISTPISRSEMKQLITICTKGVNFTFKGETYRQKDGVAMGSPLGPVLAGIFMVALERQLVPILLSEMPLWRRYVDDTIAIIKCGTEEYIINILNGFNSNIQFTYEEENSGKISFLDVLLIRNDSEISTTVYRKNTNTDLYLHWKAFAPTSWKRSTIKSLYARAFTVCSEPQLLRHEIAHLDKVFHERNGYPFWLIKQVKEQLEKQNTEVTNAEKADLDGNVLTETKEKLLILPFAGNLGNTLTKKMKQEVRHLVPQNVKPKVIFTGRRLKTKFKLKDAIPKENQHNVVYKFTCSDTTCQKSYIGECSRRLEERVKDHQGRDSQSHIFAHTTVSGHSTVTIDDFLIIGGNYRSTHSRRIAEALMIKTHQPPLNIQEKSVPLHLFS